MPWFKVDDSFYDHPKVFDAPDCAVALWTRAGTWSARNLTDGFVPASLPARLCGDPDTAVKELVRRGLWTRASGGFRFHDWDRYQPSKESVEDLRAKRAEAGRRGGQAKAAKQKASNGLANASQVGKQNPAPARPDPVGVQVGDKSSGSARASPEPSLKCPKHLDDPDPSPCGPCADARRSHDRWQRTQAAEAAQHNAAEARTRADAARAAINACRLCDTAGYRDGRLCHHDATTPARAHRGAHAARAAIRKQS